MEIKRTSVDIFNDPPQEFKPFKKKKYGRFERGRLSIFIIGGFLLLFLGLLTFEFRHIAFDSNASFEVSQPNSEKTYKNTKDSGILKFFKKKEKEEEDKTVVKPTEHEIKWFDSVKNFFKNVYINFFSKDTEEEKLSKDTEEEKLSKDTEEEKLSKDTEEEEKTVDQLSEPENKQDDFKKKKFKDKVVSIFSQKEKQKTRIAPESTQTPLFDKNKHKYSLQIMAIEEESKTLALEITKKLVQEGYKAYTYKTPVKIISKSYPNGKYFYRIRIGFFQTRGEAKRIGAKIFQKNTSFPQDYYVVKAKNGEYDGEIITYGFQKN